MGQFLVGGSLEVFGVVAKGRIDLRDVESLAVGLVGMGVI